VDLGILPGDVIHQLNGEVVRDLSDLRQALAKLKSYDPVVLHVEREGAFRFVAFELE
jgi:S1-C subfamily serine protease